MGIDLIQLIMAVLDTAIFFGGHLEDAHSKSGHDES